MTVVLLLLDETALSCIFLNFLGWKWLTCNAGKHVWTRLACSKSQAVMWTGYYAREFFSSMIHGHQTAFLMTVCKNKKRTINCKETLWFNIRRCWHSLVRKNLLWQGIRDNQCQSRATSSLRRIGECSNHFFSFCKSFTIGQFKKKTVHLSRI